MRPTGEQLSIINSRLPGTSLKAEDVEILPFRVFDDELTDRYTIMTDEMMRKLERDLNEGRAAFNTLHRTNSTLPIGRSVNARIISKEKKELHANMYAVVRRPDGSDLEDGKDVADRYNTGAVYACSAGVVVGLYRCSICGNDIRNWNDCEHIPGRTYMIDEKPVTCVAYMTGRNVVGGVAEDCGIYEVSAVTAGGSLRAGVLTETFGQYSEGVDPAEFKKEKLAEDTGKEIRITLKPYYEHQINEEEGSMTKEEVKRLVEETYGPTITENAKLKLEKAQFEKDLLAVNSKFEELSAQFEAAKKSADELTAQLEAVTEQFKSVSPFKEAYVKLVEAAGIKVGKQADYAAMTLEDLESAYKAYVEELNATYEAGQHSHNDEQSSTGRATLPDAAFKM